MVWARRRRAGEVRGNSCARPGSNRHLRFSKVALYPIELRAPLWRGSKRGFLFAFNLPLSRHFTANLGNRWQLLAEAAGLRRQRIKPYSMRVCLILLVVPEEGFEPPTKGL